MGTLKANKRKHAEQLLWRAYNNIILAITTLNHVQKDKHFMLTHINIYTQTYVCMHAKGICVCFTSYGVSMEKTKTTHFLMPKCTN